MGMILELPERQKTTTVRRAQAGQTTMNTGGGTSRSASVGRRAIRESLSTNAKTFLRSIRQESGE